nr:MAG TPA: hypothetical protein [Caudoviricetes sp.]DAL04777.1 MAG TPA: hypothetical protein [Caudoviricetes sp.]DAO38439.1 MAG TPA: hypothetical protein [Caudoviricetes sp.]
MSQSSHYRAPAVFINNVFSIRYTFPGDVRKE